jgi:sugar O-acyltransferase (sialic acid O-acetyltransferase NeuD family)
MKDIVLIGGGGHCRSVIDVIESAGEFRISGILDQTENVGKTILGHEIIGTDEDIPRLSQKGYQFVITVGQIKTTEIRRSIAKKLSEAKALQPALVASTAYISPHTRLGAGSIVHHGALVNAGVTIGDNCIINSGALIEHDCTVGDFCHISTGVRINGTCSVGNDCFIGSGSVVNNNIRVKENTIIGSNSLILSDIKKPGVYCGVIK